VQSFLPQMMTMAEMEAIVSTLEDKSLPSIMKHFKSEYAGKCDMKLVQEIARKAMS